MNAATRALIAEDEPLLAAGLRADLAALWPALQVQATVGDGLQAVGLYMLTTGMVRAFRKDPATGRQVRLGDLVEGAFFGEVSILTGGRRTATVAALTRCELLELDRPTLDSIRKTHPHVLEVLEEFARQRGAKPA